MGFLSGKKTYLFAGLAALAGAYMSVQQGHFDPQTAQTTLEALALMALRAGVAKAGVK